MARAITLYGGPLDGQCMVITDEQWRSCVVEFRQPPAAIMLERPDPFAELHAPHVRYELKPFFSFGLAGYRWTYQP